MCEEYPRYSGCRVLAKKDLPNLSVFASSVFSFVPLAKRLYIYIAAAASPSQAAQAAQLHQETHQERTAQGEVLELSNIFPLGRFFPQQRLGLHPSSASFMSRPFLIH